MNPLLRYQRDCQKKGFIIDAEQQKAVALLQSLFQELQHYYRPTFLDKLNRLMALSHPPRGIYFWGSVGRGKTYLMDLFCDAMNHPQNHNIPLKRLHFHRFMFWLHQQLSQNKGEVDPLKKIAKDFAREFRILCFDEFFVSEIGDAMLLGKLFKTLFDEGVVLITTSNIPPERLYYKGFHRDRFLPTIDLLQQNTEVFHLQGAQDFRLRTLKKMAVYYYPDNEFNKMELESGFEKLIGPEPETDCHHHKHILISGREIAVERVAPQVVWFNFKSLCVGERSTTDYIEISRLYPTIFLSGIPELNDRSLSAVRRFISLIDELYDHGVKLIIQAVTDIESLYRGKELAFEFERTKSRLHEMQSEQYLGQSHIS